MVGPLWVLMPCGHAISSSEHSSRAAFDAEVSSHRRECEACAQGAGKAVPPEHRMHGFCEWCDAPTVPATAMGALVLDFHRATHSAWDRLGVTLSDLGGAEGIAQMAASSFATAAPDADRKRRSLEGEVRAKLAMGDRRGHKRAVKALRTHDALHPRSAS